jgi:ubiquinone/menaquinone biosynthesis C-methylase UbiE
MMNGGTDIDLEMANVQMSGTEGKSDQVRQVFTDASKYLKSRQVDIRFRAETVKAFAANVEWQRLLDIGCGDGTISLQLLKPASHLTLLDLSANMAAIAKSNVPEDFAANVEVRNENFIEASFDSQLFDLVVTVGVMAHVDSPDMFLAKISDLLRPNGRLIIEFTDSRHFVGQLNRFWGRLKEVVAPPKYHTNRLSFSDVAPLFASHHLKLVSTFRYARIPLPGIDRIVSHRMQHRIAELIFGNCSNNKNAWLGNEYILLLSAD